MSTQSPAGNPEPQMFWTGEPVLLLPGVTPRKLHGGMLWAEGPVYFPQSDTLLFSDIPNNRVLQYTPGLGVREFLSPSNNTNGNTCDREGRLISCRHETRSVVRRNHDGTEQVIVGSYNGRALNSPNDVIVARDGAVWFSDPVYGILTAYEGNRGQPEQPCCGVYRTDPATGETRLMTAEVPMPNGLAFSPDERILYVADSSRSHWQEGSSRIFAFDTGPGPILSVGRVLCSIEHGVPDGLRIDEFGNIWCSSARGIEVISPGGDQIAHVAVPEVVSNLTFGGPKRNQLFITATTSLYTMFVGVRGVN